MLFRSPHPRRPAEKIVHEKELRRGGDALDDRISLRHDHLGIAERAGRRNPQHFSTGRVLHRAEIKRRAVVAERDFLHAIFVPRELPPSRTAGCPAEVVGELAAIAIRPGLPSLP